MTTQPHLEDDLAQERAFLDRVYATYTVDHSSQTRVMRELVVRTVSPFVQGGQALELGCSDGYMTELLAARVDHLDVIDGSKSFIAQARQRGLANVRYSEALFEEFETATRYDHVFASFVLEHVREPQQVLAMVRRVLKPGGTLYVTVPNARALSRQLALHMGLIIDLKALTPNDELNGHRRVYDRTQFNRELRQAGFETVLETGLMLKILADFQLDKLIDDGTLQQQQIDGLYRLGLEYPDLCGALISICRQPETAA